MQNTSIIPKNWKLIFYFCRKMQFQHRYNISLITKTLQIWCYFVAIRQWFGVKTLNHIYWGAGIFRQSIYIYSTLTIHQSHLYWGVTKWIKASFIPFLILIHSYFLKNVDKQLITSPLYCFAVGVLREKDIVVFAIPSLFCSFLYSFKRWNGCSHWICISTSIFPPSNKYC